MNRDNKVHTAAAASPRGVRRSFFLALSACFIVNGVVGASARAANVLLVISGSSINSSESARRTSFQGWGHTVTTIQDSASQSSFNTAMASADVVYIPATIQEWELTTKVKASTCGVVCEQPYMDVNMGFSTNLGWYTSFSQINNLDNSHDVTAGLSAGTVTIVSSNQELALFNNTISSSMTTLGENTSFGPSKMLGVMDTGGALAGGGTAAARRVRLPWGSPSFSWSALNANGLKIAQQAIAWAAGGGPLVVHYKLDETSGTTATDSSEYGRDGAYTGGVALNQAGPFPGRGAVAAEFDGSDDHIVLPSLSTTFSKGLTFALWAKPTANANWARFFDLGNGAGVDNLIFTRYGTSSYLRFELQDGSLGDRALWADGGIINDQWHHYAVTVDSSGTGTIYRDGVALSSGSVGLPGNVTRTLNYVARSNYGGDAKFKGGIHDVRIYDQGLTAAEVMQLYGLVAHWKLDETSGATAADATPAGNDATLTGTQGWTAGFDANGHDFDYANGEEYFEAPSNDALDNVQEDDYTVMAYFKPNSVPPGTGSDNDSSYGILLKYGWHLGLLYNADGEFQVEHWLAGDTWAGTGTWGEFYSPGTFHHIAGVVSRTDGTVKIYVDGVLKNTDTFTAGAAAREYNSDLWRIGIGEPGGYPWGYPCDGVVDDARIYNRALSEEEIVKIARTGLLLHWKLDEASGTTLADASGYDNTGAFSAGSPSWTTAVRDSGLSFNGTNAADSDDTFDPPSQGSVAFWAKPAAVATGPERLFGVSNGWEVRLESGGVMWCDLGANQGPSLESNFTSTQRWHHVVCNYDANGDTYEIYLDGQLHKSGSLTLDDQAAGTLTLGTRTGTVDYFAGSLDDIRVYGHPLTAAEVNEIYGLIGHWKFDEGAGTSIADSSGMGNDAAFAVGTPTWIDGVRGAALEFDGASSAVTTAAVDPPNEGTITLWFRSDGPPAGVQRLWGVGSEFEMWQQDDGFVSCDVATDGFQGGFITAEPLDTAGTWYHLAAVYDADDDSYSIYLNGELHKSGVSTWAVEDEAADLLSFGTGTGATDYFSGAVDDFRIYNRKLSQQEIYEIYGLVAWYKLDETSGTLAADSTGLGNDGTYIGSPTLGATSNGGPGMGTAAEFSGTNYVEIPNLVTTTDSVSVAGWANLDAADSEGAEIVSIGDYFLLRVDDHGGGPLAGYYNGSTWIGADSAYPLEKSGWHHFAAVLNENDSITLYIDGNEAGSTAATPSISFSGLGSTTRIGSHGDGQDSFDFSGRIDDVRIFDRRMTSEEVFNLYRGSRINGIKILKWVETR
ncbi:MAG: LamG domain-containing protein [Planctomycetales bacterium]|nr:LamG domain-containing protein [Planctomycetales bacterium]